MKKYLFILDSGSSYPTNLPPDTAVLPIGVTYQSQTYFKNFGRDKIKEILKSGGTVTTTQPIIGETIQFIKKNLNDYEKIIILPISKELSSHYNSLCAIEKHFEDRLIILDSLTIGIDGNWIIQELQFELQSGNLIAEKDALNNWIHDHQKRVCGVVIVNKPDQLINGGRLKGIKGLIARHFNLKLVIKFDGKLTYVAKDRHLEGAIKKSLDLINKQIQFRKKGIRHISVMNETEYQVDIQKFLPGTYQVEPSLLPDCVTCHTGFDTFSILIEAN